jgi:hypothetical protein
VIELTPEQHDALTRNGSGPPRVIDRTANMTYVLIPSQVYERLESLLTDESGLINEIMAEDDTRDPYLDSYQRDVREVS